LQRLTLFKKQLLESSELCGLVTSLWWYILYWRHSLLLYWCQDIFFLLLSANYSAYLFRQRLFSRLTVLWRYINFVLLLLLLLLLRSIYFRHSSIHGRLRPLNRKAPSLSSPEVEEICLPRLAVIILICRWWWLWVLCAAAPGTVDCISVHQSSKVGGGTHVAAATCRESIVAEQEEIKLCYFVLPNDINTSKYSYLSHSVIMGARGVKWTRLFPVHGSLSGYC